MKEKIYDARTGMEYVLVGDYYLPALKLPRTRPIGRWGMLHKAYLKLRKPAYYQSLLPVSYTHLDVYKRQGFGLYAHGRS